MTVAIEMGNTSAGQPATLDLEELLATRLLVQGNSGSGKSHLLRRLVEQSAQWVQQAIIDPEGDFVTLAEMFGHVVVDASAHTEAALQQVAARVRQHRVSVVLNLENLETERQMRHAAAFLGGLFDVERDYWFPMLVVVDEAQLFAPAAAGEVSDEARKASLGAMTNLMCRGRKRGLAGIIATQRLAKLAKNVAAEASNFLMGRTFLDIDMSRAADLLGMERRQAEMFRDLNRGHFIALGPALARRPLPIRIGDVQTDGRTGNARLMPLPETPREDARDLIMKPGENEQLRVMARPAPSTADILAQLAASSPPPPPAALSLVAEVSAAPAREPSAPKPSLDEVLREVLGDPDALYRNVAQVYQDFLVRCRQYGVNGRILDLAAFRRKMATARAGVDAEAADTPEWEQALGLSAAMPEDIQAVFLMLARAAHDKAPCPSNAQIARARGSRSPRRALGLLDHMANAGLIVVDIDAYGDRVISLPSLGWQTAPGNPDLEDEVA
ncbi:ATP-binding protein [Magnetospirillum aberrantis]|uniref:ATP-binding protein n=1 Tax=Magnetospirillum aberrantis SpK TaxID=908842 RepID=A0A7C9QW68_9PROT|nr:ATP-binding protein [Magnetospirillum aberrantis]NFV81982.1 ATP-binding protein [Magnetospirillum aberrantis SpK]